jgi:mannose-1-phosphate guanylyltransferase
VSTLNVKGVVLAAGLGTRLRPLTETRPKPLIPFAGTNPLELALLKFKQCGIRNIAINAHYLADSIESFVRKNPFDQDLYLSREEKILGTGGCYNPLRQWLGNSHLLVYNGDIISDMDLGALMATHEKTGALATMAMLPDVIPGENGFFCNPQGQLVGFGKEGPQGSAHRNFACVQILSPQFLDTLPDSGSFCIIQKGYLPALERKDPLFSYLHTGFWHDLRTPRFYLEAVRDFLDHHNEDDFLGVVGARRAKHLETVFVKPGEKLDLPFKAIGPALIDESAQIHSSCVIGPHTVIERGAVIEGPCSTKNSLVLEEAHYDGGRDLDYAIVDKNVVIQTV